ncbi:MAG: hypothetical protein ABIQ18_43640, partial [Umezawaea sp.]
MTPGSALLADGADAWSCVAPTMTVGGPSTGMAPGRTVAEGADVAPTRATYPTLLASTRTESFVLTS